MRPYIGISGITNLLQSTEVTQQFVKHGMSVDSSHQGMLGYGITWQMLRGLTPLEDGYINPSELSSIMLSNQSPNQESTCNALHFVPEPASYDALLDDLERLLLKNNIYQSGTCRVLQLNYASSVGPEAFAAIKSLMPELSIIFQVGNNDINNRPLHETMSQLANYVEFVDTFLIDPSQGQGKEINIEQCRNITRSLVELAHGNIGIGFAGGLSPVNVDDKIVALSQIIDGKHFSIDIESKVRSEEGQLDLSKTDVFIKNSALSLA